MLKFRIRGIYSTALTKLVLDNGHKIVQATPVIRERFNLEENNDPPDVTIKDAPTKESVLVVGSKKGVSTFLKIMKKEFTDAVFWASKVPLHGVVRGVVREKINDFYLVDIGNGNLGTIKGNYNVGEIITASIKSPAFKTFRRSFLSRTIRIIGDYAEVIFGFPRITLSSFIKNPHQKEKLFKLGLSLSRKQYGIRWRSSARFAEEEDLIDDVNYLIQRGNKLLEELEYKEEPGVYYEGKYLAEVMFNKDNREKFDDIRAKVILTVKGHHWAKSTAKVMSAIVDFSEMAIEKNFDSNTLANTIKNFVLNRLLRKRKMYISHTKLTGHTLKLTPGMITSYNNNTFEVRRKLYGTGIYDGLNIPKSKGDQDLLKVKIGSPYLIHRYVTKDNVLIGVYININTPVELTHYGIRYIDLLVDVVCLPDEEPKIIDLDELNLAREEELITEEFYDKIIKLIDPAKEIAKLEIDLFQKQE